MTLYGRLYTSDSPFGLTWIEVLIVLVIVGIFGGIGANSYLTLRVHNDCLRRGYPDAKLTYPNFTGYCIKRVNQTDSVVALSRLKP